VVIVIVAAFLITHGFRADPPSSWLATEPIGSTSKFVYYIHWTNHDGQLNGSMDEYYYSSSSSYGSGQSQSYNLDGTYNYQDQTVTLTVHNGAESVTIKGNISGNNMTLHSPASTSTSSANRDLTFHTASQKDFDDAKQNTNSSSY
jgi:hypothetical protein